MPSGTPSAPAAAPSWKAALAALEAEMQSRRAARPPVPTGWRAVDEGLGGGLARGALHEWCGLVDAQGRGAPPKPWRLQWAPPLFLLMHLATRGLEDARARAQDGEETRVLWIGRKVWPYPNALAAESRALLSQSVFVDPPDEQSRLWAIDLALRCPSVTAVVADGQGLRIAHSRRLQLAAEAGGTLALLARPAWELPELSTATTRWRIWRAAARDDARRPRFELELVRRKGSDPASIERSRLGLDPLKHRGRWLVEWNREAGAVLELPDVVDRSRAATGCAFADSAGDAASG